MAVSSPTKVPFSLVSKTRQGLTQAMLKNNVKSSTHFKYFDIQFVEGEWVAWFYDTAANRKGGLNG